MSRVNKALKIAIFLFFVNLTSVNKLLTIIDINELNFTKNSNSAKLHTTNMEFRQSMITISLLYNPQKYNLPKNVF